MSHKEIEQNQHEYFIAKCRLGSEEYNPPELNDDDIQEKSLKNENDNEINKNLKYDGIKADIFSGATTLFLMVMKSPPFRKAQIKDPFYKRLCANDKKSFWNIFKNIPTS